MAFTIFYFIRSCSRRQLLVHRVLNQISGLGFPFFQMPVLNWWSLVLIMFFIMLFSVIKEEGPDNEQDKEPSERANEEPDVVCSENLFIV